MRKASTLLLAAGLVGCSSVYPVRKKNEDGYYYLKEGNRISVTVKDSTISGLIVTEVRNDSLIAQGGAFALNEISEISWPERKQVNASTTILTISIIGMGCVGLYWVIYPWFLYGKHH